MRFEASRVLSHRCTFRSPVWKTYVQFVEDRLTPISRDIEKQDCCKGLH